MTARQHTVYSTNSKKFFIKRGRIKDESTILNGSIFNTTQTYNMDYSITNSELQKYQTITTAVDNTITLQTNPEEIVALTSKSYRKDKANILPKIYLTSGSNQIEETKQIQSQMLSSLQKRQKILSQHPSDPLYLRLDKTNQKRTSEKFKKYKKGWMDQCIRRKQKSVIQRSLQRAAENIQFINEDANRRKNTTQLSEMLRNNIDEKKFIFPGKLRPEIAGLKGRGGKAIPLFSEVYIIEEVYKHDRQGH